MEVRSKLLKNQLEGKTTSHSYIFECNNQNRAYEEALAFISSLMNKEAKDRESLEKELLITRDVLIVEAKNSSIQIDSIRELIKYFQVAPFSSVYKFAVVKQAETLTKEAANSMLKLLEEMEGYGKCILLTKKSQLLLPTIRSRCQIIKLESIEENSIDMAMVKSMVDAFLNDDFSYIVRHKEELEALKDKQKELLDLIIKYLNSILNSIYGREDEFFGGSKEDFYKYISIDRLTRAISAIIDIRSLTTINLNYILMLEKIAIVLSRVLKIDGGTFDKSNRSKI